jgi:lysozyme
MSLRDMLKRHEGVKLKPYRCTAGKETIGCGHNIDAKGLPDDIQAYLDEHGAITPVMVDILLDQDIEDAMEDCRALYPEFDDFSQDRQDALVDFLYNVGKGTAKTFKTMNGYINAGQWDEASDALLRSLYAKQVKGRAKEIAQMLRDG